MASAGPPSAPRAPVARDGPFGGRFREVRYRVEGTALPPVTRTVPVAEQVRRRLMGIHKRIMGGDEALVSRRFAGKQADGSPAVGHVHARFLPLDEDGDGRIDHLVVRAGAAFDASELRALDELQVVDAARRRGRVRLGVESLHREPVLRSARSFVSATPFVTRRHPKRREGGVAAWIDEEIRRELRLLGLPEPVAVERIEATRGAAPVRWGAFVRCRRGGSPVPGHGRVLIFEEPVPGPFALGSLSHFGLGLFVPA